MAYSLSVFHYSVDWGGSQLEFSEVTGLNIEGQVIEYRAGLSPEYPTAKMPGLQKYSNITLKRGVLAEGNKYFDWLNEIKLNKPSRHDIIISLLNEEHEPVVTWKVLNAWPIKITSPGLKGSSNEVAIETLEIAHEGISIENG